MKLNKLKIENANRGNNGSRNANAQLFVGPSPRHSCSRPTPECVLTVLPDACSRRFQHPDLIEEAKKVIDVAVVPNENYSVIIFSRAAEMLAEADTIQKAKELKSLALTAADWARRKNLGEKAVQHCRSYALEAERRLGQLLLQTDRAKGGSRIRNLTNLPVTRRHQ